jgi:hypothetical protein
MFENKEKHQSTDWFTQRTMGKASWILQGRYEEIRKNNDK